MPDSLVQPLFDGPVDIVGDVHGELAALVALLRHLGYDRDGRHPDNRRLVFVGDLTDRGPDSPAVVDLVQYLVKTGRAQCVLGNHDLNLLLSERKQGNHWFFGEHESRYRSDDATPAILVDEAARQHVRRFFKTLPVALERDRLRVVHACWRDDMIELARQASDAVALFWSHFAEIEAEHEGAELDAVERVLVHQNQNPVKVLTSGLEQRIEEPFEAGGKIRHQQRVRWWEQYDAEPLCVFGHYAIHRDEPTASSGAICADFAVGKRWRERKAPSGSGAFRTALGAVRLPERIILFDNGDTQPLSIRCQATSSSSLSRQRESRALRPGEGPSRPLPREDPPGKRGRTK